MQPVSHLSTFTSISYFLIHCVIKVSLRSCFGAYFALSRISWVAISDVNGPLNKIFSTFIRKKWLKNCSIALIIKTSKQVHVFLNYVYVQILAQVQTFKINRQWCIYESRTLGKCLIQSVTSVQVDTLSLRIKISMYILQPLKA